METTQTINTTVEQTEIQNATIQDNTYVPESDSCPTLDTVVPASMKYEMRKAIQIIYFNSNRET